MDNSAREKHFQDSIEDANWSARQSVRISNYAPQVAKIHGSAFEIGDSFNMSDNPHACEWLPRQLSIPRESGDATQTS